jgi:hypothetical protein
MFIVYSELLPKIYYLKIKENVDLTMSDLESSNSKEKD